MRSKKKKKQVGFLPNEKHLVGIAIPAMRNVINFDAVIRLTLCFFVLSFVKKKLFFFYI